MQDSKQMVIKNIAICGGVLDQDSVRVVNNDGEVSEDTRRRIQRIIDDLGYYPNTIARNLVNGRSNTVGLVIQHSANYIFSHPFFNEVMRGIAETLSEHNINLLIHLANKDMPYSHLYYQRLVDGLIFMSIPVNDPNLPELSENNFPSIFTCRIAEENNPTCWGFRFHRWDGTGDRPFIFIESSSNGPFSGPRKSDFSAVAGKGL